MSRERFRCAPAKVYGEARGGQQSTEDCNSCQKDFGSHGIDFIGGMLRVPLRIRLKARQHVRGYLAVSPVWVIFAGLLELRYADAVGDSEVSAMERAPVPDYSEDGVDLTLIRWMLALTPAERLLFLQERIEEIDAIRELNARR